MEVTFSTGPLTIFVETEASGRVDQAEVKAIMKHTEEECQPKTTHQKDGPVEKQSGWSGSCWAATPLMHHAEVKYI
jgi:hypothetical protein